MSSTQSEGFDLNANALELLRNGAFPNAWSLIPVAGKETYVKGWSKGLLDRQRCIEAYKTNRAYNGIGVLTGEVSGGLIALDIDGPQADERYKAVAGGEYEAWGEEKTMSWTSGVKGRRQLLYQLPISVVPELRHVKTLIYRMDGLWHLGNSDLERQAARLQGEEDQPKSEYEEVVLRFNQCQSVLPGSRHPETKGRYKWISYNEGKVAKAPSWIVDLLRPYRKPVQWLSEKDQEQFDRETAQTAIPQTQIRGWFFKEEVQRLLMPRLDDLVFNHQTFKEYGWKERSGDNPQRMSGCPWHGGKSGTAFQYSTESGCWDCKACGVGGDVLDFIHKIQTNNLYASRPTGADLERYVAEIAGELGFNYPEDARAQVTKEAPQRKMGSVEFHEELGKIFDSERNPAVRLDRMAQLAQETGRRMSGKDCEAALGEYRYKKSAERMNNTKDWFSQVDDQEFIIPNLLVRPGQVILHAAGGVGKTSACLGLAKLVGRGSPMKVRGIDVDVIHGPVLWIQSDQTQAKLKRDLEDNDIDVLGKDDWFHVRRGFQINHIHEFVEWVREIKPALVVIDSIGSCSSRMQVSEIEKAFATPLYHYNEANGSPAEDGFPSCSIIWIHHDNANGEVRGNRYLINAVDEQWHLRKLKDEEREHFRERGENPDALRMIQIKKSRAGREGDLLIVRRDENFAFSVEDYTPTVRREDGGQGDPDPFTLVLGIVKDACEAQAEAEKPQIGVTREEVWRELVDRLRGIQGDRARFPTQKTVGRWLDRWVEDRMLKTGKRAPKTTGRPAVTYRLARALPSISASFSQCLSDFLQPKGSEIKTKSEEGPDVRNDQAPEGGQPEEAPTSGHRDDSAEWSETQIPVVESDLGLKEKRTSNSHTTREAVDDLAAPRASSLASDDQDRTGRAEATTGAGELPEAPESGDTYGSGLGF